MDTFDVSTALASTTFAATDQTGSTPAASTSNQPPPDAALAGALGRSAILRGAVDIGDVTNLTFHSADIVTTEAERAEGGVVQGSWLLLLAEGPWQEELTIVLRVNGRAPVPVDHAFDGRDSQAKPFLAYHADVAGCFYADGDEVVFASEVDAVLPARCYRVYMPSVEGLSAIAAFSTTGDHGSRIPLGVVRFASSRAADKTSGRGKATVTVNVDDFIGRRTAVFGITRSGKSSTIKTLVTAVRKHAAISGQTIGQIIFDPQGEYASVNAQDGTAISQVGDPEHVRIYQSTPSDDPRARRLLLNFYDQAFLNIVWALATEAMRPSAGGPTFRTSAMTEPNRETNPIAWQNWSRGMIGLYGILHEAGFGGSFVSEHGVYFSISSDAAAAYNTKQRQLGDPSMCLTAAQGDPNCWFAPTPAHCASVVNWILGEVERLDDARRRGAETLVKHLSKQLDVGADNTGGWDDSTLPFARVVDMAEGTGDRQGIVDLSDIRDMHDPRSEHDVLAEIWDDMQNGRLVIVDLSIGSERAVKTISERIVNYLVYEANLRFRQGLDPVHFQLIVEEAHNLFERGRMANTDPWVRVAKEGAKYGIGLMYATQEVTSIDRRILANTHNWVVAHLNSDHETEELSHYYDFATHAPALRRSEEVGYVRLKTFSSPYIVPTQVTKFDAAAIDDARVTAGLAPLSTTTP